MARTKMSRAMHEPVVVHEDVMLEEEEDNDTLMDESRGPLEESGCTVSDSDEEVEDAVAEDIARFEDSFKGITKRYRLINRIGEGLCVACICLTYTLTVITQVLFPPCIRPKICCTILTKTNGT